MSWPKELLDYMKEEIEAYDQMSPELRWHVANMPALIFGSPNLLQFELEKGTAKAIAEVKRAVREEFPAFVWPARG